MKEGVKYFIMLRFGALVRLYDRLRVARENWSREAPVFVLTSGKVASTAVADSLKQVRGLHYVHHIHYLSPEGIEKEMQHQRRCAIPYIARNTTLGRYLADKWKAHPTVRPKIISLVREPIGQVVSVAFQDVKRQSPHLMTHGAVDPEKTVQFLHQWLTTKPYRIFYEWIENELNPVAGVDVYGTPFDVSAGYQIYHGRHADVLLMRVENLADIFSEACARFLGVSDRVSLRSSNSSDHKEHGEAYREVCAAFKLDELCLKDILSDRMIDHFYADRLDCIRAKWGGS